MKTQLAEKLQHVTGVNLSSLVDEAITEYINQRPHIKATFEVENNIVVKGDQALLNDFVEKLIQNSIRFNSSSTHHSIVFGRVKNDLSTFFIMNSDLGVSTGVSFGAFKYLDKKDLGQEVTEINSIMSVHKGKFWAIGKKDVGSIFYFSIGQQ